MSPGASRGAALQAAPAGGNDSFHEDDFIMGMPDQSSSKMLYVIMGVVGLVLVAGALAFFLL